MSDASSSYGLSFLDPSTIGHSPISKHAMQSESTPLNDGSNVLDSTNLSPIGVDESGTRPRRSNPSTPDGSKQRLHSILKNSPIKSYTSSSSGRQNSTLTPVSDSLLRKHPELRMASHNGEINPVKGARVIFSPTKEVVSFHNEYFSDDENAKGVDNTVDLTIEKIEPDTAAADQSFLSKLVTDPTIPYVLSLYLQLLFNLLLISIILYLIYIFMKTIKTDINNKLEVYVMDALQEISLCSREYYRNKCSVEDGHKRAPALEQTCTAWSKCMNRDPQLIGKSKITAETFADIVNGFLRPISWKSMIFLSLMIMGSLFVTNVAFGSYRSFSGVKGSLEERVRELERLLRDLENTLRAIESRQRQEASSPQHSLAAAQTVSRIGPDDSYISPLSSKNRG